MANGYYAPFYRGQWFNTNPPVAQQMQMSQQMPDGSGGQFAPPTYQIPQTQAQQVPQIPQMPQSTGVSDLIFVLNENEASSYLVAPGNTVTLWDKNDPVIYLKSVDDRGIPSMRILEFRERLPESRRTPQAGDNNGMDKYATAEAFAALQSEVSSLKEKIDSLSIKSASKTKKTEDTDNG